MTTWSVVKDDTREKRRRGRFPSALSRVALLAGLALVMIGLGVAVAPPQAAKAPEPPFSEQARAAALADTLHLRDAGYRLRHASGEAQDPAPGAGPEDGQPALEDTVRLLTTQARALLTPGDGVSATSAAASSPSAASPSPESSPQAIPASAVELALALADSGGQRLADAAATEGGMARLLAAVGTAQLLQSASLGADADAASRPPADASPPLPSGTCTPGSPPTSPTAGAEAGDGAAKASLHGALAAAVQAEAAAVYGYQVALPRLGSTAAESAAGYLARHEALLEAAESLGRQHCSPVPLREAGYALEPEFFAGPAAGLGALENDTLPVYGDLIALSDGETRQWAIAALLGASRRAGSWGVETGALPGLAADPELFPSLPAR